jgi:hypothetical protein
MKKGAVDARNVRALATGCQRQNPTHLKPALR